MKRAFYRANVGKGIGAKHHARWSSSSSSSSSQTRRTSTRAEKNLKANERELLRKRSQITAESARRDRACFGHCSYCRAEHELGRSLRAEREIIELIERLKLRGCVADDSDDSDGQFLTRDVYDEGSGGKMIGVLLAKTRNESDDIIVLKAFSGQWFGRWEVPGWCPPLAKLTHDSQEYVDERKKIEKLTAEINDEGLRGVVNERVVELKKRRKIMSRALLDKIWDSYSLPTFRTSTNNSLIELNIRKCYHGDASRLPCGCGDCAAPKLLAECARRRLVPIAIAETWMGPNTKRGAGLREEGVFYGACLERCRPILGHLLCSAEE